MSGAVISASFVRLQTMADGTPRVIFDLDCTLADIAAMGLTPGVPVAIARLTQEAACEAMQQQNEEDARPYGQQARELHRSGFFNNPALWDALRAASAEEAKARLKADLCFDSLAQIPPHIVKAWALDRGFYAALPKSYKDA